MLARIRVERLADDVIVKVLRHRGLQEAQQFLPAVGKISPADMQRLLDFDGLTKNGKYQAGKLLTHAGKITRQRAKVQQIFSRKLFPNPIIVTRAAGKRA